MRLKPNWNGRGAEVPNATAAELAKQILRRAQATSILEPERIVATPDGGIAIYFVSSQTLKGGAPQKYARFIGDNDGEILLLLHNRVSETSEVEAIVVDDEAIDDAFDRVEGFLA